MKYDSDTPKTKFNETCCKEKGVPDKCMGNCRPFNTRSLGTPKSVCDEHKETITSCLYVAEQGNPIYMYISRRNIDVCNINFISGISLTNPCVLRI